MHLISSEVNNFISRQNPLQSAFKTREIEGYSCEKKIPGVCQTLCKTKVPKLYCSSSSKQMHVKRSNLKAVIDHPTYGDFLEHASVAQFGQYR